MNLIRFVRLLIWKPQYSGKHYQTNKPTTHKKNDVNDVINSVYVLNANDVWY